MRATQHAGVRRERGQAEEFEKQAAAVGYDITVDWRDYPSAAPMVEAFVSNNLDLGMWGNTPIIRGIAQQQPWTVLNLGEGHMRFVIATRPAYCAIA